MPLVAFALFAVCVPAPVGAQTPRPAAPVKAAIAPPVSAAMLAPLAATVRAASSHAPYAAGDCNICHQSADPKQPGPVTRRGPALCLECHDEFAGILKRPHPHAPAVADCTHCHNPHNATQPKLVLDAPRVMCTRCHAGIKEILGSASVQHGALAEGRQCLACHDPHASAVERLLLQLPFDLCVGCHASDALVDAKGRKLQNTKAWLDANREWHGPIAAKDCSACHEPHGGGHFRLLKADYPPEFYAPYDERTYALCFSCHNEKAFSSPETTTLTDFRDGPKNMHFLHLQQGTRGRTCRACHEVHASSQPHHIRAGVPYGSGGWVLKLNFRKTPTGGSCDKTCHQERSYSNRAAGAK